MESRHKRKMRKDLESEGHVNEKAHDALHAPSMLIYTSPATLSVTAGSKIRLPRGGVVTRIAAVVQTGPSGSALDFDLYIDGVVVTDSPVSIAAGATISSFRIVTRPDFDENSTFYIKINNVNSAVGPLVVTIEYLVGW